MKNLFNEQNAIRLIMAALMFVVLFHLLVLCGIIPFTIVWGGRLTSRNEMVRLESVSIFINIIMLIIVAIRGNHIKLKVNHRAMQVAFWLMAALFALNTMGNIFSQNEFEQLTFSPITFILSVCCIRVALAKKHYRKGAPSS